MKQCKTLFATKNGKAYRFVMDTNYVEMNEKDFEAFVDQLYNEVLKSRKDVILSLKDMDIRRVA